MIQKALALSGPFFAACAGEIGEVHARGALTGLFTLQSIAASRDGAVRCGGKKGLRRAPAGHACLIPPSGGGNTAVHPALRREKARPASGPCTLPAPGIPCFPGSCFFMWKIWERCFSSWRQAGACLAFLFSHELTVPCPGREKEKGIIFFIRKKSMLDLLTFFYSCQEPDICYLGWVFSIVRAPVWFPS